MAKPETSLGHGNFFQRHSREFLLGAAAVAGAAGVGGIVVTSQTIDQIRAEQKALGTSFSTNENDRRAAKARKDELAGQVLTAMVVSVPIELGLFGIAAVSGFSAAHALKRRRQE